MLKGQKNTQNFSSANDVVKHFIKQSRILNGEDSIVYLQPTSPLRNYIDVKKSIKLFNKNNEKPLVSVKKQMFVFTKLYL